ncbi:Asp-tRNA(Asn)/Glu-tRNA(Gln) amidotransferase GatCAB subunit C [Candidatus Peregrinibacteria bacterium CG_4_10_14_0_2_um_filter_38_24]|nr:MAG: Asp-tRNA(Asn)/Glu-tRNA(Gln) amidotransferase GatCAB subunit C [Candidatus Peregrinibacteria bacterium CG_4_10_14_0_2_um_filter_38_24]PJC38825.1 MAG: Asp-tRNA(Asn)/Glu-tRNA(Gln) amidotransferase GatCAB subunit C [Candidatus Peregrinibacteria bacterium CG_4_9_14_0_2_um_filter_38_9]
MLTEEQVRHVAKLARLKLTDEEVKKFAGQLSGVLEYVDILKEVDTEGVEITSQVTGLKNVMRKDEVVASTATREELLACSELEVDSNQVKVMNAIK